MLLSLAGVISIEAKLWGSEVFAKNNFSARLAGSKGAGFGRSGVF